MGKNNLWEGERIRSKNKIVSFAPPPPKIKPRKMNKSPRNMKKWTMREMLKMAKNSPEYKQITGKLKPISIEQQSKQFRSLDDAINYQTRLDPRSKSEWKRWSKAFYDNMYKFNKD